ncbi:hypothetical protein VII00023_15803 [Vibrio ichthyoenteri ATCC 700023]|uniref:Transposase n=1 Tax=Vibrio ichthyoenteri ATCC 700023 TaxID=870968 RepID=F9S8A3_9VIBR|nr:hypothetical protein VII00023_15803 [Vibrio ichthyoenteri ATCC 700023]
MVSLIDSSHRSWKIHQAWQKENDRRTRIVFSDKNCTKIRQIEGNLGKKILFSILLLQGRKSFNRMRTTYADLAQ